MRKKLLRIAASFAFVLVLLAMAEVDAIGTIVASVTGDSMDWHGRWLAGRHAVNCGRVEVHGDPTTATRCALKAQAEGKPVRVVYNIMGYDAPVAGGIVRTPDGEVYALSFDGDPGGGGGVSLLGQRVSRSPCPKPIHLWVQPEGKNQLFPTATIAASKRHVSEYQTALRSRICTCPSLLVNIHKSIKPNFLVSVESPLRLPG